MSFTPAFEIGLWNAWIFWVLMIISMIVPDFIKSKAAKEKSERASQFIPYRKKIHKILALSTHIIILPFSIVYSIFLPLQTGTVWFYIGLVILVMALIFSLMSALGFANTPVDRPVTGGIYRISRNPIYLSGFFINLSIAFATVSWIILLCSILWILFFQIALPEEENYLIDRYGEPYREYMDRTPRWLGMPKPKRN